MQRSGRFGAVRGMRPRSGGQRLPSSELPGDSPFKGLRGVHLPLISAAKDREAAPMGSRLPLDPESFAPRSRVRRDLPGHPARSYRFAALPRIDPPLLERKGLTGQGLLGLVEPFSGFSLQNRYGQLFSNRILCKILGIDL